LDSTYDLVTMVNVLHHVQDAKRILSEVMNSVAVGKLLIIKDHFVNSTNVALAVLVHEVYEPSCSHERPEPLYFRELRVLVEYIRYQGWTVDVKEVPYSDVGDLILICRNSKDNGISQIVHLENQVNDLTQKVYDLTQLVSQQFNNPKYENQQLKSKVKERPIVKNNDLAVPTDDRGYKKFDNAGKTNQKKKVDINQQAYPTGKKVVQKSRVPFKEVVTTVWREKPSVSTTKIVVNDNSPIVHRSLDTSQEVRKEVSALSSVVTGFRVDVLKSSGSRPKLKLGDGLGRSQESVLMVSSVGQSMGREMEVDLTNQSTRGFVSSQIVGTPRIHNNLTKDGKVDPING